MYLLVMFALAFDGLPLEPHALSNFNSLVQCQKFLTEYAATKSEFVIKQTPVGSVTYTEVRSDAIVFATCVRDGRGDEV